MLQKIKNHILLVVSALTLIAPATLPLATSYAADCSGVPNQVANGASAASGGQIGCDANGGVNATNTPNQVAQLAKTIINILSAIIGGAAIIMIIYAGFRYITSGGSTERIGGAKNTLIYAIIGLVIVALAQILVHFVLSEALNAGNSVTT
ncbi:MAG TPA: TrbC/VirB2 family protein [Candidatus Saccharimonadales bacterium]|nr:TrbC/VirB2 family protein [Candidatus Saccharimonadales bacterium]